MSLHDPHNRPKNPLSQSNASENDLSENGLSSPPSQPLTKQRRTILQAILFFLEKGELPTVREVGALVGLRSPATVLKHLRALEREKFISLSGKSRGIRIVDQEHLEQILNASPARGLSFSREDSFSHAIHPITPFHEKRQRGVPLVGAIAAGKPFESYTDGFLTSDAPEEFGNFSSATQQSEIPQSEIPIDPQIFVESGDIFALRVEGDSMVNAGILDGDYVIIRRQNSVEEGEIAAVLINGEGTLKRWHTHKTYTHKTAAEDNPGSQSVSLQPANERFDPIVITEDDAKDVLVFGKYVGLVRGNLRNLRIS